MLGKSKFAKVLLTWQENGGSLRDLTKDLSDFQVTKASDAEVLVQTLRKVHLTEPPAKKEYFSSPLRVLTGYFQQVGSQKAFDVLKTDGMAELIRVFHEGKAKEDFEDDLMFVVKMFAMYRTPDSLAMVVEAAKMGFAADHYLWSIVFGQLSSRVPDPQTVLDAFGGFIPASFIGVTYLDYANQLAIEGKLAAHPFATAEGLSRLKDWLNDPDPEHQSYAHSATVALPFISESDRGNLLEVAMASAHMPIRLEAAWASAKIGNGEGVAFLKQYTLDPRYSQTCCQYLTELGHKAEIPAEALAPDFQAMAEMCAWLAHPMEFGRVPDHIELYDHRRIHWPPRRNERDVWLFKYTYLAKDGESDPDVGLAMVGSTTFALFGEATADLKPEEAYALHCCWELEGNGDKRAPQKRSIAAGLKLLAAENPGF
jgi:hypothetical protein